MRFANVMFIAALAPLMVGAQAKPAAPKPVDKAPAKQAMAHDMAGMNHDMAGMQHDTSAMRHDMAKMGRGMGMGGMMGKKTGWTEFDALHSLVMTISMAANKGDLKPAREKGAELSKAADAWLASKGPASCDNVAARKGMPQAVTDLKAIASLGLGTGNDAALKAAIAKAHDSFRPVAQPCMMAGMGAAKKVEPKTP